MLIGCKCCFSVTGAQKSQPWTSGSPLFPFETERRKIPENWFFPPISMWSLIKENLVGFLKAPYLLVVCSFLRTLYTVFVNGHPNRIFFLQIFNTTGIHLLKPKNVIIW